MTPDPQTPATSLAQKAARLLELHHGSQPLVLINAWDAASAAMVEHCGLPAIATSSAAMANALGFPDGQYIPWSQMLDAVARVCRAVKVPVTADIESGFAPDVTALETSITQIIQAGAVGVNLEDLVPAPSENAAQKCDLKIRSKAARPPRQSALSFAGANRAHPGRTTRRPGRGNSSRHQCPY